VMKKSFAIVFALIGLVLACASGPGLVPLDQQAGFSPDIRTGVDLGSIYFDSRDADSKSVVGAIPLGQEVVYTITARKGNLEQGPVDESTFQKWTVTTNTWGTTKRMLWNSP
jgi:hypothetical protein